MTPGDARWLAHIHGQCFTHPRPWRENEFATLLKNPACSLVYRQNGFALGRTIIDEAEILTIAVLPGTRRAGTGQALLQNAETRMAAMGAKKVFLEVAANNIAALALYQAADYRESGCRRGYYSAPNGDRIDGLILSKPLN